MLIPSSFTEIFIISSITKLLFHMSLFGVNTASKLNIPAVLNKPVLEDKCFRVSDEVMQN
jgi:hypothetical protein